MHRGLGTVVDALLMLISRTVKSKATDAGKEEARKVCLKSLVKTYDND